MRVVDPEDAIVTHDSGSPRDQILPFYAATQPRGYMGWGKSHQLGTGLGLIIGAKVAAPDKFCVNFMGDAAFGMTGLDFETAVRSGIPILTVVLNNSTMAIEIPRMKLSHEKLPDPRPRRQLRHHGARSRRLERARRGPRRDRRRDPARARRQNGGRARRAARIHHQPGERLLAPPRRRRVAPSMAPRIGYLLPTREQVMDGRPQTGPLLDLAARAEQLGFDLVWVGDSLLARPRHDPLTLLAAVAARTQKVQLGTAVFLPALRNPVVLAHQLATLDQISEGRLVLGAGIASDVPNIRAEFAAAGVPFEGRVGRMMEGLRLARALWAGKARRLGRALAG